MAQEYLPAPSNVRLADLMKEHNISQPELAARCLQNPAPCGHRAGRCYVLHQSIPKVRTLVFFASCLNIRKILQERRKSGRTATEKEKSPYWLQICNSKGRGETVY